MCKHGLQTNCHLCKFDRTSQYFWLGYAGIVCIVCLVFYYFIGVGK